jgi:hypothetical protein
MLLEKRTDFKNCPREKKPVIANTRFFAGMLESFFMETAEKTGLCITLIIK